MCFRRELSPTRESGIAGIAPQRYAQALWEGGDGEGIRALVEELVERERRGHGDELARLHPREIEDRVDQGEEGLGRGEGDGEMLLLLAILGRRPSRAR